MLQCNRMIKVHKKFIILVVIFVLLIAVSFSVWYFFFNKPEIEKQESINVLKPPTEEEKLLILENLAKRTGTTTKESKNKILENISKQLKTSVSDEEKIKTLENLKR